jgi:hypothetical protein
MSDQLSYPSGFIMVYFGWFGVEFSRCWGNKFEDQLVLSLIKQNVILLI